MLKKLEKIIRTNKKKSPCSLSLDPGYNMDSFSSNRREKGFTSPCLAQGGWIVDSKQPRWESPSKEKNSQPFQTSSFSCLGSQ